MLYVPFTCLDTSYVAVSHADNIIVFILLYIKMIHRDLRWYILRNLYFNCNLRKKIGIYY